MLTLANGLTLVGLVATVAGVAVLGALGDTDGVGDLLYTLGAVTICGATALLLELIYRAGSPLSLDQQRPRAGQDEGWRLLALALLLWGGAALVSVPGVILSGVAGEFAPELCAKLSPRCSLGPAWRNGVLLLQTLLSTANNGLFLHAILHIHLRRPVGAVEWLRGAPIRAVNGALGTACVLLLLLLPFSAMRLTPIFAAAWEFGLSMGVLGLYGLALSRALRERGLHTFARAWWTGLGLQAMVQLVALLRAVDTERFAWTSLVPTASVSLAAQALWCLSLVAQAASWFSAQAAVAARDLVELRGWLGRLRADVSGSPLADELDDALAITERHRPDLLEAGES